MISRVLQGPFLTRGQAARRARAPALVLRHRRDLLRVTGRWLPEVYFEFQFDENGVRPDLGGLVQEMKEKFTDVEIGDWLVRRNRLLDGFSPLGYLNAGGDADRLLEIAALESPVYEDPPPERRQAA
jgi:hypothetical protein